MRAGFARRQSREMWIASAEKRFAKEVRLKYPDEFADDAELEKLKKREAKYRECILKLKNWNAKLLRRLRLGDNTEFAEASASQAASSAENYSEGTTTSGEVASLYVVRPGDSLSMISRKMYGTSKYYKLIYNANRDTLKSEEALAVGQKLRIPKIKGLNPF